MTRQYNYELRIIKALAIVAIGFIFLIVAGAELIVKFF